MNEPVDMLNTLKQAVELSPDNLPLREHYAQMLMRAGRFAEAASEYRHALAAAPDSRSLKIGLAKAFCCLRKYGEGLVIIESLLGGDAPDPEALMVGVDLHVAAGDKAQAQRLYRRAVAIDPSRFNLGIEDTLGPTPVRRDVAIPDKTTPEETAQAFELQRLMCASAARQAAAQETTQTTFADVGGMEAVKQQIRLKIIYPLTKPELYKAYGKSAGGGILLYGPPGCGKTLLAKATAGEVRSHFIAVGINDILNMYIGQSEHNLHHRFEEARSHKPSVLFFDEVDALGASRSEMRADSGRMMINQFLSEMDGIQSANDGVLILAATNAPWHVDPAFRRPGRFDRIIFVPPPDAAARLSIFQILLRGKPVEDIDYAALVRHSEHFSGADLEGAINTAVERKLEQVMQDGVPKPLTTQDIVDGLRQGGATTKEWLRTACNYVTYANDDGLYDAIGNYLKER